MLTKFSHEHTQPFYLSIAKQEVNNHSAIHKFGAVPALSQNTSGSIWDVNDTLYPWSAFSTGTIVTVPPVNAADNGKTITLYGLDENFLLSNETITLSSATTVSSVKVYSRLFRAVFDGAPSNIGDINVQANSTTVLRITAGKSQTLMAIYTIPATYTGYLIKGVATSQPNADATGNMFIRYFGQQSFRIGHSFEIAHGEYTYEFAVPIRIPEKSDIDVRATTRTNNSRITAAFDLILVKDD